MWLAQTSLVITSHHLLSSQGGLKGGPFQSSLYQKESLYQVRGYTESVCGEVTGKQSGEMQVWGKHCILTIRDFGVANTLEFPLNMSLCI